MKSKNLRVIPVIIVLIGLFVFIRMTNLIINIQWYKEVGYLPVYFTKLIAILKLMVPVFVLSYLCIWLYYKSLKSSIVKWKKVMEVDPKKLSVEKKVFYAINFIFSFTISYTFASTYWYTILQFTNSVSFNVLDPLFSMDVSFYVFKLPLIESLYGTILSLMVFLIIITLLVYFVLNAKDKIAGGIKAKKMPDFKAMNSNITKFAGKQLAVVSALLMLMVSLGYALKCWNLVYSTNGVTFGGSYTDVHVTLMFYKVIVVVSLISAVVIFVSLLSSKVKPIIGSIGVIIFLIVLQGTASFCIQKFVVKSNEKTLEQPYIKNNIEYTRKAFNLDKADVKTFEVKNNLTKNDIASNVDTTNNIRINSFEPTLEFYNNVQIIRYYYTFNDLDLDRYYINGKYNQVFIAPREINTAAIEPSTWQNKHLVYTHGFGVAMNKVNSVTSEGQPDFVIKDIPPVNSTDIKLTNPRVYFGEKTNDYCIVNTKLTEFDYPKGDSNETTKYEETSGIKMSFLNKVLFAINQRDMNFLLSRDLTSESRILINRNVVDRAAKIAPFLSFDSDPYAIISGGKMYWVLDAYTTTNKYPYSQPQNNINYIRNSVKVVIDAVNGNIDFYIVDSTDPIAASYAKIFPNLFKDISKLSSDIKAHFKYPDDIFKVQCTALGKYHVTDPGVFYSGEDVWEVAKTQSQIEGKQEPTESPYMVMKLPGDDKEEMILLQYFNMKGKDAMVALFGVRMDGDNYGKMVTYKFPPQTTIYSPAMFKQRVNQDTEISKELSLWNKEGSQVVFGDTMIIPINNSLLYVEPMYLRASGKNSIPEVKKVIVSYSDKIILADSIDSALGQIFNYDAQNQNNQTNTGNNGTSTNISPEKAKQAKDLYDKALDAQKSGDWAKYGDYIKQLGDLINDLNK
ncbi:MAG: UPF0182 family protein [Solirubrobacterales bacterium]